jgi:2-iminobutanoate/2-iminopropanoate deaminase
MASQDSNKSSQAPAAVGPYSPVRWAGEFAFISGQIGLDPESGELAGAGLEEQARQVLRNLDRVLKGAGLGREHVMKTTVFLTDMDDFGALNEIYAGFFAGIFSLPARSCVAVKALPKGAKVEIEAVAHKVAEQG